MKDKRIVLLSYMLERSSCPVSLDSSDHRGAGNRMWVYVSQFEKRVLSQLSVSTRLFSMRPGTLGYICVTGVSKLIPVKLAGATSTDCQYYLLGTILSPDSVLIHTPEDILDTVTAAYIQHVGLENISGTLK